MRIRTGARRSSLIFWKVAEVFITALALFGFFLGAKVDADIRFLGPFIVMACVFLMGTHSTFYVPCKYGVLPELFDGVFTVTRIDANKFRFTLPYNYTGPRDARGDYPPPFINQTVSGALVNTTVTKVLGQWETSYRYDNQGRVILKANPSALAGYDDSQSDLLGIDAQDHSRENVAEEVHAQHDAGYGDIQREEQQNAFK